jgi:glucose-1-phosphate cytidylyltransferase
MKTVLLAGGFGTRLSELTATIPKPMVEIGGKPLLWHIMRLYAAYGHNEFVLALGYKAEVVKEYFLNFFAINNDLSIDLGSGKTTIHAGNQLDWQMHLIDTGLDTETGGRLKRLKQWIGNETFMMTYGDGLSNVNIDALLAFHKKHKKLATVTAVHPPARFGGLVLDGDSVVEFTEKNQSKEGWINGGFFVLEPEVLDYIENDRTSWERAPLEKLASEKQLQAFFHDDFWQPMDTLREFRLLESLWQSGKAPWKIGKIDELVLERKKGASDGGDRVRRLLALKNSP